MLDVKQLKQLVALYEAGTVTAAAAQLHISQPALTAHLNQIESGLGEQLFMRSVKGLQATPLGEALYHRARAMLLQWNDFNHEVALFAGAEKGEIRIVCGAVIELSILPDACLDFLQQYPGVDLHVSVINPQRMLEWMRQGSVDVAIGAFPNVTELAMELLDTRQQRVAFFVRAGHPLLGMRNWRKAMRNFPLAGPEIPADTLSWMEQSSLLSTHRNLASDSYVLLKRIAQGTDHILGAPGFLVADEVAAGKLVELPLENTPVWKASVLVSRAATHSKIVQAFITCVKRQMESIIP
jgi:DNA-binding transcriptional LysR family regulator